MKYRISARREQLVYITLVNDDGTACLRKVHLKNKNGIVHRTIETDAPRAHTSRKEAIQWATEQGAAEEWKENDDAAA
jgi:hypothetical protein